jgi:hypothetical protein
VAAALASVVDSVQRGIESSDARIARHPPCAGMAEPADASRGTMDGIVDGWRTALQDNPAGRARMPWGIAASPAVVWRCSFAVLVARLTGFEATAGAPRRRCGQPQLGFRDSPGGFVEVFDWDSGADRSRASAPVRAASSAASCAAWYASDAASSIAADTPFDADTLQRRPPDHPRPGTGESIDLVAFGPTNVAAFAQLLAPVPGPSAGPLQLP